MSLNTTRAKFIRSKMMSIIIVEGITCGLDFFNRVYDFISYVDRGFGNLSPEGSILGDADQLGVYDRAVSAWVEYREKERQSYRNKMGGYDGNKS